MYSEFRITQTADQLKDLKSKFQTIKGHIFIGISSHCMQTQRIFVQMPNSRIVLVIVKDTIETKTIRVFHLMLRDYLIMTQYDDMELDLNGNTLSCSKNNKFLGIAYCDINLQNIKAYRLASS